MGSKKDIGQALMQELEAAAKAGDFRTVEALARLGRVISNSTDSSTVPAGSEGNENLARQQDRETKNSAIGEQLENGPSKRSRDLQRGREIRGKFLDAAKRRAIVLNPVHGRREFQTESGKLVCVAFSSENARNEGHYFFGVAEREFDLIVFLCTDSLDQTHTFIVPMQVLAPIWERLVLRDGERKINVVMRGGKWTLRVPSLDKDIGLEAYLNRFESLG